MTNSGIVQKALKACTAAQAHEVQELIVKAIGGRYQRPVGDRWNNQGMLTASGSSYDHKALELVTNMQDAVLELHATLRHGSYNEVPYRSPHEAASSLFAAQPTKERAKNLFVTIEKAVPGSSKKKITLAMRDRGCGIVPEEIPLTIFQIGTNHKNGVEWQQGKFGLGGATTYINAEAVVLISRRDPRLLVGPEEDRIAVAVVQWERAKTTINAFYLVTEPWDMTRRSIPVFSIPARDYPGFEPGTHVALIGYNTKGLGSRSPDHRSFDAVLNTRLFRPVLPVSYRNNLVAPGRLRVLDGLERRLQDNPGESDRIGEERLPFNYQGTTYHLPVRFRLFERGGQKGERRNFVAHNHALIVTSNGQVHAHWTPQKFKNNTTLQKLFDRILVIVESDALPLEVRTDLFTADRTQLVQSEVATRLRREIAEVLNDWTALRDANNALIREAIAGNSTRSTLDVSRRITRAYKATGFAFGGKSGSNGIDGRPPKPTSEEDLYNDPTHFEGPAKVAAALGKAKSVYYKLNAKNGFLGRGQRGELVVECNHPDIGFDDITVGELRLGRVRVSISVAESADLGSYQLLAHIPPWLKSSGGLGPEFKWTTDIDIVDIMERRPPKRGPGDAGTQVAVIWRDASEQGDWDSATVGTVQMVSGDILASEKPEYEELANVLEVPTLMLNRSYSHLKKYVQVGAAGLTDEGNEQRRERYAVGVGVALLILDDEFKKAGQKEPVDENLYKTSAQSAARGVLSVLPDFDQLAKELEG